MSAEIRSSDFIVIGGGIAGVAAACELASQASVVLIEAEAQIGYHATGRSAAFFASVYGNRAVRAVSAACRSFFFQPPLGFSDVPLLRKRGGLYFARRDQMDTLTEMADELNTGASMVDADDVIAAVPIVRSDYVAAGLSFDDGGDIDVDALLQGFFRWLKARGGHAVKRARTHSMHYERGVWRVDTTAGRFTSPVIVNAAGAWADDVATMAGVRPLGLEPRRRTACLIDVPEGLDISGWPILVDADEELYFKPDAGKLMISPGDATPSVPCDAQPEDLDVAVAIDRFEKVAALDVKQVSHTWAGLRTFAPDESPVLGFDPRAKGFFWLAGQGGFGVQTAPGLAQLADNQLTGRTFAGDYRPLEALKAEFDPARLL